MVQITAQMVKGLREKTGAGMMDCKKALVKKGSLEDAVTFLREKGLVKAAKKSDRIAAEGLIGLELGKTAAAIVEVNCETDFVARGPEFQSLIASLAKQAIEFNSAKPEQEQPGELLNSMPCVADESRTVDQVLNDKVAIIGEKIALRRFAKLSNGNAFGGYLHAGGNIGVALCMSVADESKAGCEIVKTLAKDISMHIAAAAPLALNRDFIDPAKIEAERAIFKQQALDQGKPEKIVEKIIDGRIEKFFAESCLLEQAFVKDPDTTVKKLVGKISAELGTEMSINAFIRFKVGEGIDKKNENFVDEVTKRTN